MIRLRVERAGAKHIRIRGLDPFLTQCLGELPDLIDRANTDCRGRLYPDPSGNPQINEDWRQFVTPDLHHLFVSAGQTVAQDLTALEPQPRLNLHAQLQFPAAHLPAWISALNQARLHLGDRFRVTEEDMDSRDFDLDDPRRRAVFQIHFFGFLLELLLELTEES